MKFSECYTRESLESIQFFWKSSDVTLGSSFDFVILAGIYSDAGNTFSELPSFDKAPNVGCYVFQAGYATAVSQLTAPIVAFAGQIQW